MKGWHRGLLAVRMGSVGVESIENRGWSLLRWGWGLEGAGSSEGWEKRLRSFIPHRLSGDVARLLVCGPLGKVPQYVSMIPTEQ